VFKDPENSWRSTTLVAKLENKHLIGKLEVNPLTRPWSSGGLRHDLEVNHLVKILGTKHTLYQTLDAKSLDKHFTKHCIEHFTKRLLEPRPVATQLPGTMHLRTARTRRHKNDTSGPASSNYARRKNKKVNKKVNKLLKSNQKVNQKVSKQVHKKVNKLLEMNKKVKKGKLQKVKKRKLQKLLQEGEPLCKTCSNTWEHIKDNVLARPFPKQTHMDSCVP